MPWKRTLSVAVIAICIVFSRGEYSSGEARAENPEGDDPSNGQLANVASDSMEDREEVKEIDKEDRPEGTRYYVGQYRGQCHEKGTYYRDEFSFVICQHRMKHIQRCPAGTKNKPIDLFQPDTYYIISPFCSINLNDMGYTVNAASGLGLPQQYRSPLSVDPRDEGSDGENSEEVEEIEESQEVKDIDSRQREVEGKSFKPHYLTPTNAESSDDLLDDETKRARVKRSRRYESRAGYSIGYPKLKDYYEYPSKDKYYTPPEKTRPEAYSKGAYSKWDYKHDQSNHDEDYGNSDWYGKFSRHHTNVRSPPEGPRHFYWSQPEAKKWSEDKSYPYYSKRNKWYKGKEYEYDRHDKVQSYYTKNPREDKQQYFKEEYKPRDGLYGNYRYNEKKNANSFPKTEDNLNAFEKSVYGEAKFFKEGGYGDLSLNSGQRYKKPYDSYDNTDIDYERTRYESSPQMDEEASNMHVSAKSGPHVSQLQYSYPKSSEDVPIRFTQNPYDEQFFKNMESEDSPDADEEDPNPNRKHDKWKQWLTDLSDIEEKYKLTDLSDIEEKYKSLHSFPDDHIDSSFERHDVGAGAKSFDSEFSMENRRPTLSHKTKAEWNDWLKDLSDVAEKYRDENGNGFSLRNLNETRTVPPFTKTAEHVWKNWLTDLSDVISKYAGLSGENASQQQTTDSSNTEGGFVVHSSDSIHSSPSKIGSRLGSVNPLSGAKMATDTIEYNPFTDPKLPTHWDDWLKDSDDFAPIVGREQNSKSIKAYALNNDVSTGLVVQTSKPTGNTRNIPPLATNLYRSQSSIGNAKVNPMRTLLPPGSNINSAPRNTRRSQDRSPINLVNMNRPIQNPIQVVASSPRRTSFAKSTGSLGMSTGTADTNRDVNQKTPLGRLGGARSLPGSLLTSVKDRFERMDVKAVKRMVRPYFGKLKNVVTTPAYDKSDFVTGPKIMLTAV